jgi:hypothetical protein
MTQGNENRRNKRFVVEGIQGNVLYTSDLEILNISLDGAAIETTKRLELNREYTFKIKYRDSTLNLRGRVVWAILISKEKKNSRALIPLYRAGIRFTDILTEKANMLMNFIEENKVKTLESRVGGLRFNIGKTEDIKIDLPHKYDVKKISLSGMLVETEYPLELDSHHDIELFLNDAPVNIAGRVAYCKKRDTVDVNIYDIGVEFITITDKDRQVLKDFLKTLNDI